MSTNGIVVFTGEAGVVAAVGAIVGGSVGCCSGGETGTGGGKTGATNVSTFAVSCFAATGELFPLELVLPPFGAGWLPPFLGAMTSSGGSG
jgi:hypothetical protein